MKSFTCSLLLCRPVTGVVLAFFISALNGITYGATYEVGPGQVYASIGSVPWESLHAGDTVRIHWRAQPYQEKWVICRRGTELAPITVQGVGDGPDGALPVISGSAATTRLALDYWGHQRGIIKIGGANIPADTTPQFIVIENLILEQGRPPYTYTDDEGRPGTYSASAAAVYVEKGENITIRNCVLRDCGNGLFVASNDTVASRDVLVEGCYIHDNGNTDSTQEHNVYTEALGITFKNNRFGPLRTGCLGNNLKDRSAGLVVTCNWVEGGSRQLDLVDAENSVLLRNDPAYRKTFVYGNVLIEPAGDGNNQFIQYGGDSGVTANYRKGVLYCYHNTFVSLRNDKTVVAKLVTNEETCDFRNNIVYPNAGGSKLALLAACGVMDISHNWLKSGWRISFEAFSGTLHNDGTSISGLVPGFADLAAQDFQLVSGAACMNRAGSLHGDALPLAREYVKHQTDQEKPVAGPPDIGAFESLAGNPDTGGALISGPEGTPVAGEAFWTYYRSLGIPSLNDAGQLAFKAQVVRDFSISNAVLSGTAPTVLVRQGAATDGAGGATFNNFKDPLLNEAGAVAFLAQLTGTGVTPDNDWGVWSNAFGGGVRFVARAGDLAAAAGGARLASFCSVALESGTTSAPTVAYVAKLTGAGVSTANDLGLWSHEGTTTRLLLREGMSLDINGKLRTLIKFDVLSRQAVTQGQGFGLCNGVMAALLTFSDKSVAVATVHADGSPPEVVAMKGDAAPEYGFGV